MGGGKVLFYSEDEALVGIKRLTVTDPLHVSIWSLTQKSSSQLTKELFWLWRLLLPLRLSTSPLGQDAPRPD